MKRQIRTRASQLGTTLAELALYLVIVAILAVVAFSYFQDNSQTAQTQQLATDMQKLAGTVKITYANQYVNVSNTNLSTGSMFQGMPSLNNASGTITLNVGGGSLTVAPGTVYNANDSVKYTLTQLPNVACRTLGTVFSKTAATLKVNTSDVKTAGGVPNPANIACSSDKNTIEYQMM